MNNLSELKRNITNLFQQVGLECGYSESEVEKLQGKISYEKLLNAIEEQERSVYSRLEFEPYEDQICECVQSGRLMRGTLLYRGISCGNDEIYMTYRRYIELWISKDMQFVIIACTEFGEDLEQYVYQQRDVLEHAWPQDEVELDLVDLVDSLQSLYGPLRGTDGVGLYELRSEW